MKFKYPTLLFLTLLSTQLCIAQLNPKIAPIIAAFGQRINNDLAKDNIHGSISVAIMKDDQIIWSGAFGYANSKTDTLANTSNIYRIGSITKIFTSTLMMQLVEEGRIKLDDPVENYLPEIKNLDGYANLGTKITFRQLASHTAGLKREPDLSGASVGPLDQWEAKLLTCIPKTGFVGKPGGQFLYSNMGVAILGLALQRITGVPYMQMVQQRILTPLHMNDTFFALPDDKRSRMAEGMENSNGKVNTKLPLSDLKGRGYRVPNGGIFSTPTDLAKFAFSLQGKPALLTAKSRKIMQEIPDGGENYGLGLMIIKKRGLNIIGHDGSVPGYTADLAIEQNSGYAVILMRNYNKGATNLVGASNILLEELKKMD
ncbi:MAG: serine hydrolase domain-containing protein [Bacteroidota bacterium]